jgi:general secretion pathway protein G
MNRRRHTRRGGFTLLEVLLVVGILALLAAFVVPNIMQIGDEANDKLAEAAVGRNGTISSALKKFRFDLSTYPEDLSALYERPSDIDDDDKRWKGPYLEGGPEELKDPWMNEYQYRYPGEFHKDGFDLWSMGKDSKDGTDDDIKNWTEK